MMRNLGQIFTIANEPRFSFSTNKKFFIELVPGRSLFSSASLFLSAQTSFSEIPSNAIWSVIPPVINVIPLVIPFKNVKCIVLHQRVLSIFPTTLNSWKEKKYLECVGIEPNLVLIVTTPTIWPWLLWPVIPLKITVKNYCSKINSLWAMLEPIMVHLR